MMKLAESKPLNKVLRKEIKEYSFLKIQEGHFEYRDVLETLKTENKYDKAGA